MIYHYLTAEQRAAYLLKPYSCPFCNSVDTAAEHLFQNEHEPHQAVNCNDCGRKWIDKFSLTGIATAAQNCTVCNAILENGDEVAPDPDTGYYHLRCRESE